MDEGSYMKSVLAGLKDKKNTVGELNDAMGDASLLKTEVLREKVTSYRRHKNALFTADTDCRE